MYFLAESLAFVESPEPGSVEITREEYAALFAQPFINKRIAADSNGRPVLVELPVTAPELFAKIDAERDRRIDAGVEFAGVHFQSRATDRENIAGAAQLGFMAMVAGAQPGDLRWSSPDQDFAWIATDNSLVPMDAQTVVAFGKAAAERKQTLIFAARMLKDMESIPSDYTEDKWWP